MFTKVLVAEDYEIANQGIVKVLNDEVGILDIKEAKYCDDAYIKFRKAHQSEDPFELLITDLSFKEDHKVQTRTSGIELIQDIRKIDPTINVIVYSQESRPDKINMLFQKLDINGYVCKGQHAIKDLVNCIQGVYKGDIVLPSEVTDANTDNIINLDDFDIMLLEELALGFTKKEIVQKLKKQKISPNSESTIDKRVSKLFDDFKAKNTTHLVAIVKDLGLL
ncbi:DNA-binding response regulator, NarL/FixJ family, contains REC and HTH domains [Aquimarina amphilecti]|uniref:DNA-binding response regulator, NarL/FixJ family, contains REC and HTH domains n=1 Tax=Aquimarina amphilecti TaxID=1038014 RepID=A0A1H7SEG1_AQUAM|nr:response regulator [Aquimarina amphilecti]SEL71020.1 DNA-binding response regulator, NarL/FixJ family, contains REC and HTH domains [Aquimarina amphilecti]